MKDSRGVELIRDGETFIGVVLGADYTAEHEFGIAPLGDFLGFDARSAPGIARRSASKGRGDLTIIEERHVTYYGEKATKKDPSKIRWAKIKAPVTALIFGKRVAYNYSADPLGDALEYHGRSPGDNDVTGAWDGGEFLLIGHTEVGVTALRDLAEGISKGDIAIWVGASSNPFGRGGLTIVIPSRMTQEQRDTMRCSDEEADRLKAASDATGIADRLKAAGLRYSALSPRWKFENGEMGETKHPVVYWLNTWQPKTYGWFTVEELDQWIAGEGPVGKKVA